MGPPLVIQMLVAAAVEQCSLLPSRNGILSRLDFTSTVPKGRQGMACESQMQAHPVPQERAGAKKVGEQEQGATFIRLMRELS